jgi:polysaccharide chain length determinant protein (PEP-CTERM system associated)
MTADPRSLVVGEEPAQQKGAGIERLRAAWGRRKWLAILAFVLPATVAVSVISGLPTMYRSTATVLVDRQQVPEAFVRSTVTSELETRLQAISQETLSRSRLEGLVTRFGLYPDLRARASSEEVVERMRGALRLELKATDSRGRASATTAFALSYQGRDPQTVALVTNAIASFYIEENLKLRERQATGTADFLKGQLAETRKRLDEVEARVSAFRKRHLGELPQQMQANMATLENLSTQLRLNNDNQTRVAERRDSLTALLAEAASSPQVFGAPPTAPSGAAPTVAPYAIEPGAGRLAQLRQELGRALARYTEQHPTVVRLKAEIAGTEREVAEIGGTERKPTRIEREPSEPTGVRVGVGLSSNPYILRLRETLSAADSEAKVLKAEEQRLRAVIAAYQAKVENTPKREQEFLEVSRDYDTTKQLYESLLKRHEEAQLAESMEQRQKGEQFRILDPAVPSATPVAPNRPRLLLMTLALSAGLAAGVLVLAEMLDTSFHSVLELRAFTTVAVLASIPRITSESDRRRVRRRFRLAAVGAVLGLALVAGSSYFVARGNESLVRLLVRDGA